MFFLENFFVYYRTEINRFVEVSAAITGLLLYNRYKVTPVKYFIFFLVYLTIGDYINTYIYHIRNGGVLSFLQGTVFEWNYWWTTLFWKIGSIVFFSFYYSKILDNKNFKKFIKYVGRIFLFFSLAYILINWKDYFVKDFLVIKILGAIIIIICSVLYFIEVLISDRILTFYKSINFYISFSIFIWWLITTPLSFYEIYNFNMDMNYRALRIQVYIFSNIFMYSTFIFALIWCRPQKK